MRQGPGDALSEHMAARPAKHVELVLQNSEKATHTSLLSSPLLSSPLLFSPYPLICSSLLSSSLLFASLLLSSLLFSTLLFGSLLLEGGTLAKPWRNAALPRTCQETYYTREAGAQF